MSVDFDLGHGVRIQSWIVDDAGNRIGLIERHPGKNGEDCAGSVRFDTPEAHAAFKRPGAFWQVLSWEPLTLSPSLLCSCGNHGWILDGKWVPA